MVTFKKVLRNREAKNIDGVVQSKWIKDDMEKKISPKRVRNPKGGGNLGKDKMGNIGLVSRLKSTEYNRFRRDLLLDIMAMSDGKKTVREMFMDKMLKIAQSKKDIFSEREDVKLMISLLKILTPESPKSVNVVRSEYHDHYPGESEHKFDKKGNIVIDISKMPGYEDIEKGSNK